MLLLWPSRDLVLRLRLRSCWLSLLDFPRRRLCLVLRVGVLVLGEAGEASRMAEHIEVTDTEVGRFVMMDRLKSTCAGQCFSTKYCHRARRHRAIRLRAWCWWRGGGREGDQTRDVQRSIRRAREAYAIGGPLLAVCECGCVCDCFVGCCIVDRSKLISMARPRSSLSASRTAATLCIRGLLARVLSRIATWHVAITLVFRRAFSPWLVFSAACVRSKLATSSTWRANLTRGRSPSSVSPRSSDVSLFRVLSILSRVSQRSSVENDCLHVAVVLVFAG